MGFDIQRFPDGIDEELICTSFDRNGCSKHTFLSAVVFEGSICGGVLQDPVQVPTCEHAFCQVGVRDADALGTHLLVSDLYSRMALASLNLSHRSNTVGIGSVEARAAYSKKSAQPVSDSTYVRAHHRLSFQSEYPL